jgi:hypothetical protein
MAQLTRERDRLRVELAQAQLVIEVQKKVALQEIEWVNRGRESA